MSKLSSSYESLGQPYDHPIVLTEFIMISELICIFFYLPFKRKFSVPSAGEEDKPIMPWYMACIPVLFDLGATPLSMIGLSMVAASVYSMMRGMIVVFAALMSMIFLG